MIKALILVGIGGGIGSALRYLTAVFVNKYFLSVFPLATFSANLLGCLLIGILLAFIENKFSSSPDLKFLFITGFCGGYTTFSTFALENVNLLYSGNYFTAFLYIALSVVTGLFVVWLGLMAGKMLVY